MLNLQGALSNLIILCFAFGSLDEQKEVETTQRQGGTGQ